MLTIHQSERVGPPQPTIPLVLADSPLAGSPFVSRASWNDNRPAVLVIACSDGRMQEHTDDFLHNRLGISHYDRLFAPGGPGALAGTTDNFARSEALRRECAFLIRAHAIEDIYLIFHGPSEDGPAHATCADYIRRQSFLTPNEIRAQQQKDAVELLRSDIALGVTVRMHAYRCEVRSDLRVQFVPLG
jgi:hypothetical protein